jgi:hypothetical protein
MARQKNVPRKGGKHGRNFTKFMLTFKGLKTGGIEKGRHGRNSMQKRMHGGRELTKAQRYWKWSMSNRK